MLKHVAWSEFGISIKKGPSVETEGLNDCLPYEKKIKIDY